MVKYGNQVRKIVENHFETEGRRDNIFDLIENNFIIQILTLERPSFLTYIKLITRKFKDDELRKYRQIVLKSK